MIEFINETLDHLLPEKSGPRQKLYAAARYSLLSPAKRIRPRLVLATAGLFGIDPQIAVVPACALEMVHTYSLIHDDLPSMDDDDFRRGKPSLHRAFDEATAILVGDFLLTYAFELLAEAPRLTAEQRASLIATLAKNSGGEGMVGGQIMDLSQDPSPQIAELKTGALFIAAMQCGGLIAKASTATLKKLINFGRTFGLLFQTLDDIQDGDQPKSAEAAANALHNQCENLLSALPFNCTALMAILDELFSMR